MFFSEPWAARRASRPGGLAAARPSGLRGASGHGSAYDGATGSLGRPARSHIATLASAKSTVSMLAFLARPR